jgi:hypothetical protein
MINQNYDNADLEVVRITEAVDGMTSKERAAFRLLQTVSDLLYDSSMIELNAMQVSIALILETMKSNSLTRAGKK